MRALIVDDDFEDRLLIKRELQKCSPGCIVDEDDSYKGGRDTLSNGVEYDIVFIDRCLGDGEGDHLLPLVNPNAHCILMSNVKLSEYVEEKDAILSSRGILRFLVKAQVSKAKSEIEKSLEFTKNIIQ